MFTIEKNKRLSQSLLWELQRNAYLQFGPNAWGDRGVPFYLTSNPLTAKQFSHVIAGYIKDNLSDLKLSEPFYIFDLGAGSGRLGYLILKYLLPMVGEEIKICYVMTDMVEKNLSFWKEHPYLKPYLEKGNLDFALYHHETTTPLVLRHSGKKLTQSVNPIALVCTYYFDTVPQDYFRANHGHLEEGRISISVPDLQAEVIAALETEYEYFPIDHPESYYPDRKEWNEILGEYVKQFEEARFLFPSGGLESLRYFEKLSGNRLLLLAGDQGVSTEEQIREWEEPKVFKHASFSMAVSYHAIARYFEKRGGAGFLTSLPNTKFVVMSGVLGGKSKNTSLAFREHLDAFEPVEFWEMTNFSPGVVELFSLEQVLLYVKLGNWDPMFFMTYFFDIQKKMTGASAREKKFLQYAIKMVWENFYPVSKQEADFVMNLGVLLFQLKEYQEALFYFQKAKDLGGENDTLNRNIDLCRKLYS